MDKANVDDLTPEIELELYERLVVAINKRLKSGNDNPEILNRMLIRTKKRIKELKKPLTKEGK